MEEIFKNVRQEVKETAELAFNIALRQNNPIKAADFLNTVTNFYKHLYTEEEIEFLRFYFTLHLEMMNE